MNVKWRKSKVVSKYKDFRSASIALFVCARSLLLHTYRIKWKDKPWNYDILLVCVVLRIQCHLKIVDKHSIASKLINSRASGRSPQFLNWAFLKTPPGPVWQWHHQILIMGASHFWRGTKLLNHVHCFCKLYTFVIGSARSWLGGTADDLAIPPQTNAWGQSKLCLCVTCEIVHTGEFHLVPSWEGFKGTPLRKFCSFDSEVA